MSPVQVSLDITNIPFILFGDGFNKNSILSQDAGRGSVALVFGTVMAKISATGKWEPFTDETATDGTAIPRGIFVGGDVTGAALVAGDVVDVPILVGGNVTVDTDQLTIENSKTLATVINATGGADNIFIQTVEDALNAVGIFTEATVAVSAAENA